MGCDVILNKESKGIVTLISVDYTLEALGIRNLSAVLRKAGFDTRLLLLPKNPYLSYENTYSEKTLAQVAELVKDSVLIGISTMSYSKELAKQLTGILKTLDIPLVWGGIHPTIKPEECLESVDSVCIGEGERTVVDMANSIVDRKDYRNTAGLFVKDGTVIRKNEIARLIDELDSLPYPDFDFENEFVLDQRTGDLKRVYADGSHLALSNLSVILARGCPHTCTYCYNSVFKNLYKGKGKWLRFNSIEYCIGLLKYFQSRFPDVKNFQIVDDNFLARPSESISKFAEIYKDQVKTPFSVYSSPKTFQEDKMSVLIGAGMNKITIGIQSGSDFINKKVYKRNQDRTDLLVMAKKVNKYRKHVFILYDFLALNPYEKESDILSTIALMRELPKPYYASLNELDFYPGSELTKRALDDGIIKDTSKSSTFNIVIEEGLIRLKKEFRDSDSRYANFIYALTKGLHSRWIYGVVPSFLLSLLVHPITIKVIHAMPRFISNALIDIMLAVFTSKYLLRNLYRLTVRARGKLLSLRIKLSRRIEHIGPQA